MILEIGAHLGSEEEALGYDGVEEVCLVPRIFVEAHIAIIFGKEKDSTFTRVSSRRPLCADAVVKAVV